MALISCPECNENISGKALKCPKCGFQLRKARRSFLGKVFKWGFVLFNILMAAWIFVGYSTTTEKMATLNGAESAGAALGAGLAITFLIGIWIVGDIFLGLFVMLTRPKY